MNYIIIIFLIVLSACSERYEKHMVKNKDNPNLYTIGKIGDVKLQVGFSDVKE